MTDTGPARALPSATVVLVRDAAASPEVLMVQRHQRATFGAVYAFPGGVVSAADEQAHPFCRGVSAQEANQRLNVRDGGLDFYSAAIRELFEETGVLLARDAVSGAAPTDFNDRVGALESARDALVANENLWPDLLQQQGLVVTADALHYIGHWETPLPRKHRFSTRFFLALLPDGQEPLHDGRELIDSRWLTPARVLELAGAGDIEVAFPTARNLERLAEFSSLGALQAWARDCWRSGIPRVRPVILEDGDELRLAIPGDPDYPVDE